MRSDQAPQGWPAAPGRTAKPKGVVDIGHVMAELTAMGTLPEPEPTPEDTTESVTVSIMGQTRTMRQPIDREARLERAAERVAERRDVRDAVAAELGAAR